MSLNSRLSANETDPQRCSCTYKLESPLRAVGQREVLPLYDLQTPEAARHRASCAIPFDKPDTLYRPTMQRRGDEVRADASEVAAIHGNIFRGVQHLSSRRHRQAHPTWSTHER